MAEERMLNDEILLGLIKANSGGGGGGTTDYDDLNNKPQINGTTLTGNKSASDLSLASTADLAGKQGVLTAGDYIEIDGNEISVNPVVPNENVTYEFKTKDASGSDATVTLIKKSGDTVISSTDYRYESVMGNKYITVDDLFYFGYSTTFTSGSNWGYKLLAASADHAVDYTRVWGYGDTVDYTENFTSIDHSGENLVLKAQMDTALSGKQDTLTFDSVPTDGSTNPVESNGVYDALALKQDKTDNTLQTTDKTVAGAVNELKSGLTNLDNEVNGDAVVYPYADVITIPDAVPSNLADCNVKIEPVQDLHGQSAPYVGGAGKNKLRLTLDALKTLNTSGTWNDNVYSYNDIDYTVTEDGDGNVVGIKVNGTTSSRSFLMLDNLSEMIGNTVIMNGCPTGGVASYTASGYCLFTGGIGVPQVYDTGSGVEFTVSSNGAEIILNVNNTSVSNLMFYPMIRLATETDPTFAPYTNICHISGHTEAVIIDTKPNMYVDGTAQVKNVSNFDTDNTVLASTSSELTVSGNKVSGTTTGFKWLHVPYHFVKGKTIYCDMNDTVRIRISSSTGTKVELFVGVHLTYTPSETFDGFVDFAVANNATLSNTKFGISLTSSYDIDDYNKKSPYYTIALGDTIYGGTVDFDSGVMTVDRADVDMSTLTWTATTLDRWYTSDITDIKAVSALSQVVDAISDSFVAYSSDALYNDTSLFGMALHTNGNFFVRNGSTSDTPTGHICYELATPFTVQLTPQQIQLLKGTNTLTASTGQISVTVNGVSGAIGALTEDVAGLQSGLDEQSTSHVVLSIPANTYNTREAALTAMYTTYNALSSDKKRRAYIIWGDTVYRNGYMPNGYFSAIFPRWDDGSSAWISQIIIIDLEHANMLSSLLGASGTTTTNLKANAQDVDVSLCY